MMAAMEPLRLDLVDDQGRWVEVTVQAIAPVVVSYQFLTIAKAQGTELQTIPWRISPACDELWVGGADSIGPQGDGRQAWYARGILHLYCRRFPAVLGEHHGEIVIETETHFDFFASFDRPFEPRLDLADALDRIEYEIVEGMLWACEALTVARQPQSTTSEFPDPAWEAGRSWKAYHRLLRRHQDDLSGFSYLDTDSFFRALRDAYEETKYLMSGTSTQPLLNDLTVQANEALRGVVALRAALCNSDGGDTTGAARVITHRDPDSALKVVAIELENIRGFAKQRFDFTVDEQRGGLLDCALVVGDNARGKSSLLRAIALGLCPEGDAAALLKALPGHLVRNQEPRGSVRIILRGSPGEEFTITSEIEHVAGGEVLRRETSPAEIPWDRIFLCGYGPQRSNWATASHDAYQAMSAVRTLFDYGTSLQNPELVLRRQPSEVRRQMQKILLDILLLDDRASTLSYPTNREVELRAPFGTWPLTSLADGYRSTTQWVLDLIGWSFMAGYFRGNGRGNENISGIVLIDELEQHLHPRWQRHVVQRLHQQFPNVQFIVSTHAPMITAGVADLEDRARIWRLDEGEDLATVAFEVESEELRGMRADQMLTSPAFGLVSSRSPGSAGDIARYSELRSKKALSADERQELEGLGERLRQTMVFGETPYERDVERAVRKALEEMSVDLEDEKLDFEIARQLRELFGGGNE